MLRVPGRRYADYAASDGGRDGIEVVQPCVVCIDVCAVSSAVANAIAINTKKVDSLPGFIGTFMLYSKHNY